MKNFTIFLFLLLKSFLVLGQDAPPLDSLSLDTIIYQSPLRIGIEAQTAVRFQNNADVYLKWAEMPNASVYCVRYQIVTQNPSAFTNVICYSNETVLENLPLDSEIKWDVIAYDATYVPIFESPFNVVSTAAQIEPINVSTNLYNYLSGWFSNDNNTQGFCGFFDTLSISKYEKASFLQAYFFENASFTKPNSNASPLSDWYPSNTVTGSNAGDYCFPLIGGCNCKVISKGSNKATPNKEMEDYKVIPVLFQLGTSKQKHRLEAGAAKFVSLFQDRSGGQTLEMSNMQGTGDNSSVTTAASELAFFLACLYGNGGSNTNLPEDCICERPLHLYYQYATSLHVRSEKKSCIWSKGAEATAEDLAFVGLLEGKTGDLTAIAAGRSLLSNSCSSDWNPTFWIKLLDLAIPLGEYYIQSQGQGQNSSVPTQSQINDLIAGLQTLLITNFANNSGSCDIRNLANMLVSGSQTLLLKPNNPIKIGLFSSYYVRTRGYGCWKAEAGVASDYYLLGVVESQLTETPICCVEKFANYIAGSLSSPAGSRYSLHAPFTIENRLQDVGFILSTFGSWNGYNTILGSGIVDLVGQEYNNEMYGPSCILDGADARSISASSAETISNRLAIETYPTATSDLVNVEINVEKNCEGSLEILDLSGKLIQKIQFPPLTQGKNHFQFSVAQEKSGSYLCRYNIGGQEKSTTLFKL